jgi:hypothetical protein
MDLCGFIFGASGAALLALNRPDWSRWGFVLFLASNVAWIAFALEQEQRWLLLQTMVFTGTSLLGIWQWFRAPRADAPLPQAPGEAARRRCGNCCTKRGECLTPFALSSSLLNSAQQDYDAKQPEGAMEHPGDRGRVRPHHRPACAPRGHPGR